MLSGFGYGDQSWARARFGTSRPQKAKAQRLGSG